MHMAVDKTSLSNPEPWGTPILPPLTVGALGKCVASSWHYIEKTPGEYDWAQIDRCVQWAAHFGIRYFQSWEYMTPASLGIANPDADSRCWPSAVSGIYACMGVMTDQGRQQWIRFNQALALRYKGNPGMDFYEGWNEPPYGPKNSIPPIAASQLADYERDRVTAIRASDPAAKVASPAFILDPSFPGYATFLDRFLGSNPPAYDYYTFHADYKRLPEDELETIARFREALAKHGADSPTILATEGGRGGSGSGGTCPGWPSGVTTDQQQAFVARMELLYWSAGVARHYWYAYDTCGTISNQPRLDTLTPAGIAYAAVENWMTGAVMSRPCAPESGDSNTWTCTLVRDGGYQATVVWNTAGPATWTAHQGLNRVRTLDGNSTTASAAIAIGPKPVLVEIPGATAATPPVDRTRPARQPRPSPASPDTRL